MLQWLVDVAEPLERKANKRISRRANKDKETPIYLQLTNEMRAVLENLGRQDRNGPTVPE